MQGLTPLVVAGMLAGSGVGHAVFWRSPAGGINVDSNGAGLTGEVLFELGVFKGSFVPTTDNVDDWAANWVAAQRVRYVPGPGGGGQFEGLLQVLGNPAPFVAGKRAYIWGFDRATEDAEWILVSDPAWVWPQYDPLQIPFFPEWSVDDASEVVVGEIDPDGSPFLMRTETVEVAYPPPTTWGQWLVESFSVEQRADQLVSGPAADPDHDGLSNEEEYGYGTPPLEVLPSARVAGLRVAAGPDDYPGILVPVRSDRDVVVEIGVSGDLVNWDYDPAASVVAWVSPAGLGFRSVEPIVAGGRQFLRARVRLAE